MGKALKNRVRELRSRMGLPQVEFAAQLGVAQSRVSAWEKGSEVPSPESLARIGNKAPYPDCIWFWEKAGIDFRAAMAAATTRLKEQGEEPAPGKTILVPPLKNCENHEKWVPFEKAWGGIYVDARFVSEPGAVASCATGIPVERALILDTSKSSSVDLQPFWDQEVLVHVEPGSAGAISFPFPPSPGYHMGILRLLQTQKATTHFVAFLGGAETRQVFFEVYGIPLEVIVGHWEGEPVSLRERSEHRDPSQTANEAKGDRDREIAFQKIRLFEGCTIVGRVICSFWRPEGK